MPSSISSSEANALGAYAPPLPFAPAKPNDRAQVEPESLNPDRNTSRGHERVVPSLPWVRLFAVALACVCVLMTGWELEMRHLGLRAGDLDDGLAQWAAERRKVDSGPRDSIVLIGDSRILFDTDLATWQSLTGRKPIQLALPATNAQAFLHDLANDDHFAGLAVIGTAEISYLREGSPYYASVFDYMKTESYSQRTGAGIYKALSRGFAFLDSQYTMFTLIEQNDWPDRKGVSSPYQDIWKVSESSDDRQTHLWDRIETDPYLRGHVQRLWRKVFSGEPIAKDVVDHAIAAANADIARIRARGGDVVWVRPPSTSPILDSERQIVPRAVVWDRILRETGSFGIYFEDYPAMQHLPQPEWSHLTRPGSLVFTDAYVHVLLDHVAWLKNHPPSAPASAAVR